MGGALFTIRGELSEAGYAMASKRGWFSRALGFGKPRESELVKGMTVVELSSRHLPSLKDDFRHYLRRRIPDPWPATQNFLDYLNIGWGVELTHNNSLQPTGGRMALSARG